MQRKSRVSTPPLHRIQTSRIPRRRNPRHRILTKGIAVLAGTLLATTSFLPPAGAVGLPDAESAAEDQAAAAQIPADAAAIPADAPAPAQDQPWLDPSLPPEERADLLIAVMTLEQKVTLLIQSGGPGLPELGIPPIRSKDGCCGLALDSTPTTALPVGVGLASTFNPKLAQAYGHVSGEEARTTGYNAIAGPTMDLVRTPYNGRMWEDLGEDPLLSGDTATNQVIGEQDAQVSALVKHYNLNNFETRRGHVDVQVDERTLQETYTRPWASVIQDGNAGAVMCSFNKVNGEYACGNDTLLNQVLKSQLGFQGFVSSDFNAAHSFADYAAGLDVSGPGDEFSGDNLLQAVLDGTVPEDRITDAARRVALTMFQFGIVDNPPPGSFENPQPAEPPIPDTMLDQHAGVAEQVAAQAAVLLKNDGALPLDDAVPSVGLIGADVDWYIDGGGSGAIPNPARLTTILDGITARAGGTVTSAAGTDPVSLADTLPGPAPVPSGVLTNVNAEYRLGLNNFEGEPELARTEKQVNLRTGISNDTINTSQVPGIGPVLASQPISARWTGTIVAPATAPYTFSLTNLGAAQLFLDDQQVITNPAPTLTTQEITVDLAAGQTLAVRIDYTTDAPNQFNGGLNDQPGAMIRFGWTPQEDVVAPAFAEAVELAASSSVAVVVARDYTGEAADRGSLTLPQDQDRLISAVAAVNPNTIVVLATSGPVTMPWIDQVPAVLETWYPGQSQGITVAGLLYGDINPSGKLPVTFPVSDEQAVTVGPPNPFDLISIVDPVVPYTEEVFVGYKAYLAQGAVPLFPFGHGLSYTEFDYGRLDTGRRVNPDAEEPKASVSLKVRNTGQATGRETVQVYVGTLPTEVPTPPKQLAGYGSITLAPGERGRLEIQLDPRSLQYWDVETDGWVTPTGRVPIYVGSSVEDIRLEGYITIGCDRPGHGKHEHSHGHGHGKGHGDRADWDRGHWGHQGNRGHQANWGRGDDGGRQHWASYRGHSRR